MPRPKNLKHALPGLGRILYKFAPHLRQQGWLMTGAFVALLAETGFRLLEPWPLKFIFDRILVTGFDRSEIEFFGWERFGVTGLLTLLAVAMVLVATARGFCAYLSTVGMAVAATRVMTDIRSQLYSHIQRLSLAFHSQAKSGDLMTRVTYDIERLREVTVVAALPLLTNLLTMVGMIGVMFWVNGELALIAIAIFPLFLITTATMSREINGVARKQRKREGAMAATAAEAIGAIKVVQALSLQGMLETAFARQNKQSLKEGAKAQKLRAGQERTVEVLVSVATALVLWRGVQLVRLGSVTPGDLLVFISYLKMAFKPMRQLAKYTGQIAKAIASGERILDLFDIVPEIRNARGAMEAPPFRGGVEFRRVSFGYEPDQKVLDGLNFTVEQGERIALVGASGGGKSTLASLLPRLYDPWEGQIFIDGIDLRAYKIESLRQQISIVLQDSVLFAATVRDNIAYGSLGASDREIMAAAKLANAHDFILELPEGYDTVLGERGATLSGGQRQRIAIARAAIRKAPIVILDEPTVGLDNNSEALVNEALERLTRDRTTFLITHDLEAARSADRIFYIEGGQIHESGTHEELLERGERYADLYVPKVLVAKC
ncbi:MAG: ABC transporter ATP-binding protein [Cyanobacteriota bacterium]|nr:ABC transporter ATP-binding protein [Cyanobacteriota bacterium]